MVLASVIVTLILSDGFLKLVDSGHQVGEASFQLALPLLWYQRKLSINFGSWKLWSCQNEKMKQQRFWITAQGDYKVFPKLVSLPEYILRFGNICFNSG